MPNLFSSKSAPLLISGALALILLSSTEAAKIPLSYGTSNRIMIACTYGGISSYCAFDSGARMNNVATNSATKSLPVIGTDVFQGAAGVSSSCDIVDIPQWTMGQFVSGNVHADRCNDPAVGDSIGINFFSGHTFSMDLSSAMRIDTDVVLPKGETVFPLHVHPKGWALIPVSIGASSPSSPGSMDALWDTGSDISLVDQKLIDEQPDAFTLISSTIAKDSTGHAVPARLYAVTGLKLGNQEISSNAALAHDFSSESQVLGTSVRIVLGRNVINQFKWYLDITRKKWAITPISSGSVNLASWPKLFSFVDAVQDDGSVVSQIHEMNDVKLQWSDVDAAIAELTHKKQAIVTPEYIAYREGAVALLGPALFANNPHDSIGDAPSPTTPQSAWITLVQPETKAEVNCLTLSRQNGKTQGCGDVFQDGLTGDKVACFQGKTYIRCHLDCMEKINLVKLDYTPGRCGAPASQGGN